MKQDYWFVGIFFSLFFTHSVFSQMTLFGDLYIAPQSELHIASDKLYFEAGKIITDRGVDSGTLSFARKANWESANHDTHVDGFIRFYDSDEFIYPVGHRNIFQPIYLINFKGHNYFDLAYNHMGHQVNASFDSIAGVSKTHYWELRNPRGSAQLILSWNVFSGIDKLLGSAPSPEKALDLITIGGFDGERWIPIQSELKDFSTNGGSVNSLLKGYIESKNRVDFSKFSAFTLMMRNIPAIESKEISQAITPNGDGKNDTWIIEGIEQYPKAQIFVYNRWGEVFFSANRGYKNDWAGNYKNNRDLLPTGPYYYIIDFENDGRIDLSGWIYISD